MDAQRGIARRMVIGLPADGLSEAWKRDFSAYPPAGVIVFRRDFADLEALRRLTTQLRSLAAPRRLFIAIDEEGGFVSQLAGHFVVPPGALLFGRGAERGDVEWASRVTAERLRALGVDWAFAPVADVHSEPRNPVIGPRAWGERPDTVAGHAGEAVRGLRAGGVASCLKHFPGHGDTELDSHVARPVCRATREVLVTRELPPFEANLEADAVMTAHVVYPALDGGRPATFSRTIVQGLLRSTLGFEGVCITDALEMHGAAEGGGPYEAGRQALEAGCDMLLYATWSEDVRRARLELARALVDGLIRREPFDAARPRLDRMDKRTPPPSEADLAVPLARLTPEGWEERLERIAARGLRVRGAIAGTAGPWAIEEPETGFAGRRRDADGPLLAECLRRAGLPVAGNGEARAQVIAVNDRAVSPATVARLEAASRAMPTVVVALASEAFLDDLPGAAVRVAAGDDTPVTRRAIARAIAGAVSAAAPA